MAYRPSGPPHCRHKEVTAIIISDLDLGDGHPYLSPQVGDLTGQYVVEGAAEIVYGRAGQVERMLNIPMRVRAWQAIGGQSADTRDARRYFIRQLEELALNRELQPVFIQWEATAVSGAQLNTTNQHDGWYYIDEFKADYTKIVSVNQVPATISVSRVAPAEGRPQGVWYYGGPLSSNYSGAAQTAVGYPLAAANQAATAVSRTGGEGAVPVSVAPSSALVPLPFTPSATRANWFKGGCRVYDTVTAGSNAVPTDGTFAHATWVEVKHPDHRFEGDCIVTNGLLLLRFQTGTVTIPSLYLWSTAQTTPGWLKVGDLNYYDNAVAQGTLRGFGVQRVGLEECRIVTQSSTSGGNWAELTFRLQRGQFNCRVDLRPLTQATTTRYTLTLSAVANLKISYNESSISDAVVGSASLAASANYGYAASFVNNTAQPFLVGWLYQNTPTQQPGVDASSPNTPFGDTSGPAQNAVRSYGVFAIPYGASASTTTDKLQAEAESGTLGTGWSSQADGTASGGNTASCASGTASGNADLFGTAFVPPSGTYDVWFRVKVTSAAGAAAEMQLGLWNSTDSVFVGSTTYRANQVTTSYAWYRVAAGVTPTATKNMRFRAVTAATLGTNWFIDEAVIVPLTLSDANTGPQEIWQQFLHDRGTRLVRG